MSANDPIAGRGITLRIPLVILTSRKTTRSIIKQLSRELWCPKGQTLRYYARVSNEEGSTVFRLYTENLVVRCYLDTGDYDDTFFRLSSVRGKNVEDRRESLRWGVKLVLESGAKILTDIRGLESDTDMSWVVKRVSDKSDELEDYVKAELMKTKDPVDSDIMEEALNRYIDELKDHIEYVCDYEREKVKRRDIVYSRVTPLATNQMRGVSYRFILQGDHRDLIAEESLLSISPNAELDPSRQYLSGKVTIITNTYLDMLFVREINFTDIPESGYLHASTSNAIARIQLRALDDWRKNKIANKFMAGYLALERPEFKQPIRQSVPQVLKGAQQEAFEKSQNVLDFLLVQGPPGTGKTTTIIEMVKEFVRNNKRVLISSHNNLAVDNVLDKCVESGINAVRLGHEHKVKIDSVRDILLDRKSIALQTSITQEVDRSIGCIEQQIGQRYSQAEQLANVHNSLKELERIRYNREDACEIIDQEREKALKKFAFHNLKIKIASLSFEFFRNIRLTEWERKAANYKKNIEEKRSNLLSEYLAKVPEWKTARNTVENSIGEEKELIEKVKFNLKEIPKDFLERVLTSFHSYVTLVEELQDVVPLKHRQDIMQSWKSVLQNRELSLYAMLIRRVSVIGATCIGINSTAAFKDIDFDVAIVDEAGQITIFDVLVPMTRAEKVILVGDHMQLPPVAPDTDMVNDLEKNGYHIEYFSHSLFERMFEAVPPANRCMLDTQFRSHPSIAEFVSNEFYDGKYRSGLTESQREGLTKVLPGPFLYIDTAEISNKWETFDQSGDKPSYYNELEAEILSDILVALDQDGQDLDEIGVIAPYSKQAEFIHRKVKALWQQQKLSRIPEIASVDSFQGRDKKIILFSFTRANRKGSIGFLRESRRLNVTVTRCKYHIVCVGDSSTLRNCKLEQSKKLFNSLIDFISNRDGYYTWSNFKDRYIWRHHG